jgi:Ca2+-dependent lipid-binding protein
MANEISISISYFLIMSVDGENFYDNSGRLVCKIKDAAWFISSDIEGIQNFLRFFDIEKEDVKIIDLLLTGSEAPVL